MNTCPVCGYLMNYPASDYHICPSCGTEFGYDDANSTHEELRDKWLKTGPSWWSKASNPPFNWNPIEQVSKLK